MKKILLFMLLLIGGCTLAFAQHQIPMQIIDQSSMGNGPTNAPPRPWYITQDENVLTLPAFDEGFTLQLLDEDETVIYSTFIPAGTTQVVLPSTLSGDFEIRLIPFNANYYFRGYLIL
jgi:hypothetical protein